MAKKQTIATPIYRQIAVDIAKDIATGKYGEGQKLFGRSVLASQYGVSPETIRKAVFLLKDVGILETEKGSGIEIVSTEKAVEFIERQSEIESVASLKNEIVQWIQNQAEQTAQITGKIQHLMGVVEKQNTASPLNPFQIRITGECKRIGETLGDMQFWHNTGGTIIAIRSRETMVVSPGPYATLHRDDVLFVVGNLDVYSACMKFLYD